MAKPLRFLREHMPPEAQAAAEQQMQAILVALLPQKLQQAQPRA